MSAHRSLEADRRVKRRTLKPVEPQTLFGGVLFGSISWPWKSVHLERESATEYRQRMTSGRVSVAELYHENTKLFPQMLPELTASFVDVSRVREEYLRRRADVAQAHEAIEPWLDSRLRTVLTEVAQTCDQDLFYAVELCVVAASQLLIHEPISDTLKLAKRLRTQEVDLLEEALNLLATPAGRHHADPLVALVGHFSRNDVLFGARGYRRTILEAGRVAEEFLTAANRLGLSARPVYEFADRQMDEVVEADGIEVGTLVLLDCGG